MQKKNLLFFIIINIVFCCTLPRFSFAQDLQDAVVKIFTTSNAMDYYRPWQSEGIALQTGSGSIIKGSQILTNAHVVADQTFIQVQKNNDPQKYTARLLAIGHDCDLALLTVDDPKFFHDVLPLEFGELPQIQDKVIVLGYPQGGGKLSITEGVVSRIEVTPYSQSTRQLLTVQIDAAINPGNSGGPILKNGKMVGVAMQVFSAGQNIGYMIPPPVINHFFDDLDDGDYDGFPIIGIDFQSTENKTLRDYYDIKKEGGVMVNKVLPFSPGAQYLKEGDIILEIDGVQIGEDGTFAFRRKERLSLPYLITKKQIDESIRFKILRHKKIEEIEVKLFNFTPLVPPPMHFKKPSYYIFGGNVFTILSTDLIKAWGNQWWEKAPIELKYYIIGPGRLNLENDQELIVLLNVLSDDINVGYQDSVNQIVKSVNGEKVQSFKQFVQLLNQSQNQETYTIIETQTSNQIILDNSQIINADKDILKRNSIPYQYSSDVKEWLTHE